MGQMVRSLGVVRSTGIGVAAMLGAGVFFVWAPAYSYAGSWLLVSLLIAAVIATFNALVTTQLAINVPTSGGIYAFGRHYRGPFTGFVAGWMFLTGKTASVAAIALIAGGYLWPQHATVTAVVIVVAGTAVTVSGIRATATVSFTIAAVVTLGLVALVVSRVVTADGSAQVLFASTPDNPWGVVTAAGLMFFAFAGYARMATLAEEVVEPRKTLPRAIGLALGIVLAVYALVGWSVSGVLAQASTIPDTPLRLLVSSDWSGGVTALAVVACAGSLLAILAGLSRTALQMGREGDLPRILARMSGKTGGPTVAEISVGLFAVVAVLVLDVTGLVALSGAGVLTYYAIGHWSALKQSRDERLVPPVVPRMGLVMCLVLVVSLPWQSVVFAGVSLAVGSVWFLVTHRRRQTASA
jgi:basic amino acid/polyamine antiporter, APA family